MELRNCIVCGKEIISFPSNPRKTCSKVCQKSYYKTFIGDKNSNFGNKWSMNMKEIARERATKWHENNKEEFKIKNSSRNFKESNRHNIGKYPRIVRHHICKICGKEYENKSFTGKFCSPRCKRKNYYHNHKYVSKLRRMKYYNKNKSIISEKQKIKNKEIKIQALSYYSGHPPKCQCCGERQLEFLTLDHVNDDGKQERERLKLFGSGFYNWVVKNKPNNLQVLCYNCNLGKRVNGRCPHKNVV